MSRRKGTATIHQAVDLALADEVTHPLVQAGQVFGKSTCYGCGRMGVFLYDRFGCWCAACGGLELVALDMDYSITTGKATIGGSKAVHLVERRGARTTLCLPDATVGRMHNSKADVSCDRCLAVRDRTATSKETSNA